MGSFCTKAPVGEIELEKESPPDELPERRQNSVSPDSEHRSERGNGLNSSRSERGLNSHRSNGGGGLKSHRSNGGGGMHSYRSRAEEMRRTPRRKDSDEDLTAAEKQLIDQDLADKLENFAEPIQRNGSSKFTVVTRAKSEKHIKGHGWHDADDMDKFKMKRTRSRRKDVKKWAKEFKSNGSSYRDSDDEEDNQGGGWLKKSEEEPDIKQVIRTASTRAATSGAKIDSWKGFDSDRYDAGPAERALRKSRTVR